MKYIDAEKLETALALHYAEITIPVLTDEGGIESYIRRNEIHVIQRIIDSLQQEMPDKETILRICKLHKAWSIMAPWENVEDFVTTNWNSENIV